MYREPAERSETELEVMAREGKLRRETAALRRQETSRKELAEQGATEQRMGDLMAERVAKRSSRAFRASFVLNFFFTMAVATGLAYFAAQNPAPIVFAILGGVVAWLALLFVGQWGVLGSFRRVLVARERAWARDDAYGLIGYFEAVGRGADGETAVSLLVDLDQPLRPDEVVLVGDALAAISPNGKVTRVNDRLTLSSGTLGHDAVVPWVRAVVRRLLPNLEDKGILRVELRGQHDRVIADNTDAD